MSYGHASELLASGQKSPAAELRVATARLKKWADLNPRLMNLYLDFKACLRDLDHYLATGSVSGASEAPKVTVRSGPGIKVIQERTCRDTGTVVQVIDNRDGSFDTNAIENPWYTVCVDHGGVCSHMTRRLATDFAPVPNQWCPVCQGTDEEE